MPLSVEESQKLGIAVFTANVRCLLSLANMAVVYLDQTILQKANYQVFNDAVFGSGLFLTYALTLRFILTRGLAKVPYYALLIAILDVTFAGVLVATTHGYLSPFQLWFVFAVVASGFTSYHWLPITTTLLALAAHVLTSAIPQEEPLDVAVFIVRTAFLFGFAATVASVGSYITRQAESIRSIERLGAALAETRDVDSALNALFESLCGAIQCLGIRMIDEEDRLYVAGSTDARKAGIFPIYNDGRSLGHIEILRDPPLLREEERTVNILVERFGTTLRRMELTQQLIQAAGAEERLRLADRLHDGFIQTLAAVDMRAEAAKGLIRLTPTQAADELEMIKHLARDAAAEARTFLTPPEPAATTNRHTIRALLERRWAGACEVSIDDKLRLSDDQWQAVEMLAREGSNNAIRHGFATEVWLEVKEQDDEILVTLQANGKTPRLPVQYGYGLSRLSSEVQACRGKLALGRRPEGGSVLTARFPKEDF